VLETFEAGLVLTGPEVKSVRAGKVSLTESFARLDRGEVWLHDLHISPYEAANRWNTDPVRSRKLLLHRRQIRKLIGETQQAGNTLVPLDLYIRGGYVKVTLALVRGKKLHDKRQDLKRRESQREIERAVRTSSA
jgi:SsrA-binding protein